MKRKDWIIILLPLFVVWLTDHLTKIWGESLSTSFSYGLLTFRLYHNHGAFLGFFSDLPPLLRIVSLSTIGAFLVFSYAIIQYMLPIKSLNLRLGMSILLGGIIGNVTDRIIWGYVVDFLILDLRIFESHPLNLADIYQWIGYAFIVVAVLKEEDILWPEANNRTRLWIFPNYQLRYILFLLIITLSLTLIGAVFSFTYLKVTIFELIGENHFIPGRFLIPYLFTYMAISFTFCCFLIPIGRRVSHRNAGPIYAFDKYVSDLMDGRNRKFKLRSGDEFKQLEKLGAKIAAYLQENNLIDRDDDEKVLTTQASNSQDCTLPAVPIDEQMPDYSGKQHSIFTTSEDLTIKNRRECPLCGANSCSAPTSPIAPYLIECEKCHLLFDPSPTEAESENRPFNNLNFFHTDRTYINAKIKLQKALKIKPATTSLLAIGTRNGDSLYAAKDLGLEVLQGLERSVEGQRIAQEKGFNVLYGSLQSNARKLGTYDLILMNDEIERVADPASFLKLCLNHLNKDGLILVEAFDCNARTAKWLHKNWPAVKHADAHAIYSSDTLEKLMSKQGLTIIRGENSSTYMSISTLVRWLTSAGYNWASSLARLLPQGLKNRVTLPVRTGTYFVIARKTDVTNELPLMNL